MIAAHLEPESPRAGAVRREEAGSGPYELVLELSRADNPEDAHGFRYGDRDYLVRVGDGGVKRASISWGDVMGELAELTGERPDAELARRLGERMRRFLDALDWGGHEEALARGRWKGGALRLVVRSSAAELYSLPWELVTLEGSGRHLADVPGCTLRYEWPRERDEGPRPGVGEGRVLFAWSEAGGGVPVEKHLLALMKASLEGGFDFEPRREVLEKVSLEGLEKRLREAREAKAPVSVLHLLCHGAPLETSEPGHFGLALNGPEARGGAREVVDGVALGAVLAPYADTLRMVVLCACHGGDGGRLASHLGSVAQELHRAGIDMVVASRLPLSTEGSALLTETLYEKLLVDSCSLEEALGAVRRRLRVEAKGFDWASLQLYARREGEVDLRPVVLRPYRGLLAFGPKDRRFFFGRSRLEAELLERVEQAAGGRRPRFQVVAGASGAGKSSVVMAGLLPQLPREEWESLVVRPGELLSTGQGAAGTHSVALRELRHRLHRVWSAEPPPAGEGSNPRELLEEVRRLRQARPERKLLLVVDQLEEVFTQLGSEERQALMRAVWALGKEPELGCVVVATVRVDHFERCGEVVLDEQTRLDTVVYSEEHRLFVAQLGPEELAEVIEKPAHRVGLELEEGLVERLVEDVGQEPGALPLLEHALDLLWQRREGRRLTHHAYEELGGVAGALTQTAERLYTELREEERQQARRLLVRLVAARDIGGPAVRGRVWVEEVRPREAGARDAFELVLEKLVHGRLLVKGGSTETEGDGQGRGAWVQLAHETLLRRWKLLSRWVEEDWEREQQLRELEVWAEDWEAHLESADGGASYLLTGDRLGYAKSVREKHGGELSPRGQRLLEQSQALEEHLLREAEARHLKEKETMHSLLEARARAARFFRGGFAVTAVLLLGAVVAVVLISGLRQQEQAQRKATQNTTRLLLAEQARPRDPTQAALFLREVDSAARGERWVRTALEVLHHPMAQSVLRGHGGKVYSAVFSPDGQRIVTASEDGTALVWSVEGELLAKLEGHTGPVHSAVFSPDGRYVVTASADKTVRIWSTDGEPLGELPHHSGLVMRALFSPDGQYLVTASTDGTSLLLRLDNPSAPLIALVGHRGSVLQASFSPDSQRVVTASADGTACVWSTKDGKLLARLAGHGDWVFSAAFSPDGKRIVTASKDKTARLWSTEGKLLAKLEGHEYWVMRAAFSPDGKSVVTGSDEGMVRLWSASGRFLSKLEGHTGGILTVAFSPDGQRLLTASVDSTARLWSAEGAPLATLAGHGNSVLSAAFSPDGERVVTASEDGTVRVWNARGTSLPALVGHDIPVHSAAFSPDGQRVITVSKDKTARLWSVDGVLLATLQGHTDQVFSAAFSPDGQLIVTASKDKTARLWSAEGLPLATLSSHQDMVISATFSPDGKHVLTASVDGSARVWDLRGAPVATLGNHFGAVLAAVFSPDGQRVVTASGSQIIRLWSVQGQPLGVIAGKVGLMYSAAFSPDGQRFVTASGDTNAYVWSADGQLLTTLSGHTNQVMWAAFSPDSQRIVTASLDGDALVWRVDGTLMTRLPGHANGVVRAVFNPDGQRVATVSGDGLVYLWSADGTLLATLRGHTDMVLSVAFSPDGERVVMASSDKQLRVWPLSPGLLMEQLARVTRDCLSLQERQTHLEESPEEARVGLERCQQAQGSIAYLPASRVAALSTP